MQANEKLDKRNKFKKFLIATRDNDNALELQNILKEKGFKEAIRSKLKVLKSMNERGEMNVDANQLSKRFRSWFVVKQAIPVCFGTVQNLFKVTF